MIYEPKGKAREYSPLAANLYSGCNHGCLYCYAPDIRRLQREQYLVPAPAKNAVAEFEKDAARMAGSDVPVLLCFMSDPYNSLEAEARVTRQCLESALKHGLRIKVLTKSALVLRDLDLSKQFGERISVGMTLTFSLHTSSIKWEPGASLPTDRIAALRALHEAGVRTWASFEPVIVPWESIDMIRKSLPWVDEYKIGKINNYQGIDADIDWPDFLEAVVIELRGLRPFYVKDDLAAAAPGVVLLPEERKHE